MAQISHPTPSLHRLWAVLLVATSAIGTFSFACVTPFAAFAVAAAYGLSARLALFAVGGVWLANQAVGFAALDYPWTLSTVIWGLAIGAAALLATAFASAILRDSRDGAALTLGTALALGKALAVAFVAYQAVLVLVALWLGGLESFTPAIIGQFALLNLSWAVVLVGIWELLRCANASALPATGAAAGSG